MIEHQESETAKLCAFTRAWHSNTAREKLFDDYLAYDMMGFEEFERMKHSLIQNYTDGTRNSLHTMMNTYFVPIPLSRIRFFEERLAKYAKSEKVQYVICGAGADTFSFRNRNANIEIFEIDHPDTQRYKLNRIRQLEWHIPENVHFVPVNFEKETMQEKLLASGFQPEKRSFFSIPGVSYYLSLPIFTNTLEQIAELSSTESVLTFDFPLKGNYPDRVQQLAEITASLGEKMHEGFTYGEISRTLYRLGFQIDTYLSPEQVQEQYFKKRQDYLKAFENVAFLSADYTGGRVFE